MINFIKFIGQDDSPTPPVEPSTISVPVATFRQGFTGSVKEESGRLYGRSTRTLWAGWITGSEAKITASTDFGDFDGVIQVALDGGAFQTAPRSGQVFTLFSGTNQTRFVEIRYPDGTGDAAYVSAVAPALEITGQPPKLVGATGRAEVESDSPTALYSAATTANTLGFAPRLQAPKGQDYGSNVGSVKLRGAFKNLVVTLNGARRIGVSKNGSAPVFYAIAEEQDAPVRALRVPCDGSLSTYYVWDDGNYRNGGCFAVCGDSPLTDIGIRRRLDQYGDSVTYGEGPGATSGDVETMPVAAAMGFVGSTNGISGLTIEGCNALLTLVLPARAVGPDDVAILAIGGNNAANGIGPAQQAEYGQCIDKLLAKGYGKVLCRGILPVNADLTPANSALKSVVDGKADPKVIWVPTETWTSYETLDGVHPTAAGYTSIAAYALPVYSELIL